MMKHILILLLIFRMLCPLSAAELGSFFDNGQPPRLIRVAEVTPITFEAYPPDVPMASSPENQENVGIVSIGNRVFGTGFVTNGYVVTCAHVINDMKPKDIITFGKYTDGVLVAKDKKNDVAVLSFDGIVGGLDSFAHVSVHVGDKCTTEGYSGKNTTKTVKTHTIKIIDNDIIYTDGIVDFGRSGAPLLDKDGKVVGVFCGVVNADQPRIGGLQYYSRVQNIPTPKHYKITMYSGERCTFCQQQHLITDCENDKRITFDWTFDPCPGYVLQRLIQPYSLPVGVWQCPNNTFSYPLKSGVHTIDDFVEMCEKSNAVEVELPQAMGASPERACGALAVGPYVDDLFNWYSKYLPIGTIGKMSWIRSGSQNFNIYGGKKVPISLEVICGLTGVFDLSVKYPNDFPESQKLKLRQLKFSYQLDGDDIEFKIDNIRVFKLVSDINGHLQVQMAQGEQPKGFIGFMTLWTIVSTVHTLYVLFHPVADIMLGSDVSLTTYMVDNDNINIDFTNMPSLRVISIMTFNLGLKQLLISRHKVILKFTGSRLIKQYTMDIK